MGILKLEGSGNGQAYYHTDLFCHNPGIFREKFMKATENINNYTRCPIGDSSCNIPDRSLIYYAIPTCSLRKEVNEPFLKYAGLINLEKTV
jgi:hypothetical protein